MNIALIAENSAGMNALRIVLASGHRLAAVLTSPPATSRFPKIWAEAEKIGIQPIPAREVKDRRLADEFRSRSVDVILNVHSLYVVHHDVITSARVGAYNLHPGPLPRYAGLNAPSWAIYRDEREYGVTLHKMSPDIDAGPIVYQTMFLIAPTDTGLTLNHKCWKEGLSLIERFLRELSTSPGSISTKPQDLCQREYFHAGIPQNGRIEWDARAHAIHNFVRACDFFPYASPWGAPTTTFRGNEVGILRTSLTRQQCLEKPGIVAACASKVLVACVDEWLGIDTVMLQGEPIDAADWFFANGASSLKGLAYDASRAV